MGIFLNEVGYYKNSVKKATVSNPGKYQVIDVNSKDVIFENQAVLFGEDKTADLMCYVYDFSGVSREGDYIIKSEKGKESAKFSINDNVYDNLLKDMVKCLYLQRCGCELPEKYAGEYKHHKCHTSPSILLEDYLNKAENPKKYDMTGGWHDAGDFGKYISPAAVTVGHILYAYELFKDEMSMGLNIPESGSGLPDVLSEVRVELEWMLKMQSENGGVYHKVTTFSHPDFIMPEDDKDQMLIFPASSIATADFVAAMALASRVYKKYDKEFSDRLIKAARKSYAWLEENDYIGFHNPEGSNTGEYDDESDLDERMWAAAEMLRSDSESEEKYRETLEKYVFSDIPKTDFGWTDVSGFTLLSVLNDKEAKAGEKIERELLSALYEEADRLINIKNQSGFDLAMEYDDFVWGSNMVVTNRGMLFVLAAISLDSNTKAKEFAKNSKDEYVNAAGAHIDYILGRNALKRSYVTGYGEDAFKNPHNRTSACDGIDEPMPGWVSGGPFKDFMDADALKLLKKGTAPQKCHVDVVGSYSTNEITIYWNSSMIFLTAGFCMCRR